MVTGQTLAALHASAFDAPWSATEFDTLLMQDGVFALAEDGGFILCRMAADETEILTLAVAPRARRAGLGLRLVQAAMRRAAQAGAANAFLEVAVDNAAAVALYAKAGFGKAGLRRGYYARPPGPPVDALVLRCDLNTAPA